MPFITLLIVAIAAIVWYHILKLAFCVVLPRIDHKKDMVKRQAYYERQGAISDDESAESDALLVELGAYQSEMRVFQVGNDPDYAPAHDRYRQARDRQKARQFYTTEVVDRPQAELAALVYVAASARNVRSLLLAFGARDNEALADLFMASREALLSKAVAGSATALRDYVELNSKYISSVDVIMRIKYPQYRDYPPADEWNWLVCRCLALPPKQLFRGMPECTARNIGQLAVKALTEQDATLGKYLLAEVEWDQAKANALNGLLGELNKLVYATNARWGLLV
jgi:hypothetical protein